MFEDNLKNKDLDLHYEWMSLVNTTVLYEEFDQGINKFECIFFIEIQI